MAGNAVTAGTVTTVATTEREQPSGETWTRWPGRIHESPVPRLATPAHLLHRATAHCSGSLDLGAGDSGSTDVADIELTNELSDFPPLDGTLPENSDRQLINCPHNCPCDAPRHRVQSQRKPTRSMEEVEDSEGFTSKIEVGQEAGFRLANRRLQPLGHLTVMIFLTISATRRWLIRLCSSLCSSSPDLRFSVHLLAASPSIAWSTIAYRQLDLLCLLARPWPCNITHTETMATAYVKFVERQWGGEVPFRQTSETEWACEPWGHCRALPAGRW
jgi:hypothetical protein